MAMIGEPPSEINKKNGDAERADELTSPDTGLAPTETLLEASPRSGRMDVGARGLREHTARGVVVNALFQIAAAGLSLLQRFAVAAFITVSEFGIWGIVLLILITLSWLKEIGISDKYLQQDEPDQELAFQKAFTLELAYTGIFCLLVLLSLPLFGLVYDNTDIVVPAAVLTLSLIGGALQAPIWVYFRRMQFVRQRTLALINPITSTAIMIPLAAAGAGYWSIVAGIVAGSFAAAIAAIAFSPYRLALRYDRGTLGEYVRFSAPLLLSGAAGILIVQGTMIVGNFTVGLAGLGALTLAGSLVTFTERVDQVISQSIYPAVAAAKNRRAVLFEAFVKSNRLALMFGLPFGFGMLLFAPDLIRFVFGERWLPAATLLQALGLIAGFRQVAFNWDVFVKATGDTRPLAVNGLVLAAVFLAVTMPAMILWGLDGYIVGASASLTAELLIRARYLRRLFEGFRMLRHMIRAAAPVLPAVLLVVGARVVEGVERDLPIALGEFVGYCLAVVAATLLFEGRLLREMLSYLPGDRSARGALPKGGEA